MNLTDINTQIIFTTVPIWVEKTDNTTTVGTGFFYQKQIDEKTTIPFIVTNAHVVKDAKRGFISLIKREDNMPVLTDKITAEIPGNMLDKYVDESNDLAVFPIGPLINQLFQNGINIFFRAIDPNIIPNECVVKELSAVEEITFIGYPSGLYDRKNNTPIVRKGITATPIWNDFDGRKIFLIDAGVYPGSSGSPVLIINIGSFSNKDGIIIGNRILFLGIISKTLQRTEENNNVYLGLGEVVKSSILKDFIDKTIAKVNV